MKFQANLTVNISKQGSRYVAYSPALDLSTSGKSQTEVRRRFVEIVNLFVEELEERGTTSDVLRELGWQKDAQKNKAAKWVPPVYRSEQVSVRIPVAA